MENRSPWDCGYECASSVREIPTTKRAWLSAFRGMSREDRETVSASPETCAEWFAGYRSFSSFNGVPADVREGRAFFRTINKGDF